MTDTSNREMITTRTINASSDRVWKAFINPEHVKHWWGPSGFTNTIQEMDVRPGGVWRFMMHGPDGIDYPNKVVFKEVIPGEKLVYSHQDDSGEIFFETILTLEAQGYKTKVTLHATFSTEEALKIAKEKYGALEGAAQNLERWDNYVQTNL